jgi:uncharacterized protein (TIGR02145 family)
MKTLSKPFLIICCGLLLAVTPSWKTNNGNDIVPNNPGGTVTDIDGNIYKTVTIGTQTWMAENLKVTRYNNGDSITCVTGDDLWFDVAEGACCIYKYEKNNSKIYGRLYNWGAVSNEKKIAPKGWHVPTDADWSTLITFLGGDGIAGGKMKETGTTHWKDPNTGADNSSGFNGLPGGYHADYGFLSLGSQGYWWSSTEHKDNAMFAWSYILYNSGQGIKRSGDYKTKAMSVRCVKDN